ncbi:MAG: hypothetical protein HZB83_03600 [Deltaproteobacteria bacterium]|nr:hypothetical protein [Deltaproteobacteria bacterium]
MSSAYTVDLLDRGTTSQTPATGFWGESYQIHPERGFGISGIAKIAKYALLAFQTVTTMTDPWLQEQRSRDAVVTISTATNRMLISELGWSREQALETRMRLRTFEEDWNAPGMESYDEL